MRTAEDRARIEANFRAQYESLDDDVLRSIAAGDVPWADGGQFVYEARRAARAVLVARGAPEIPPIPAWDPASTIAPWRYRLGVIVACLLLAGTAAAAWVALEPLDTPDDATVCAAARALLDETDFAYHHRLETSGCVVDHAAARETHPGGEKTLITPVAFQACIHLDADLLARLKTSATPRLLRRIQAFARAPIPGEHCRPGDTPMVELVVRPGRPWYLRVMDGFQ